MSILSRSLSIYLLLVFCISNNALSQGDSDQVGVVHTDVSSQLESATHAKKSLEIYRRIISIPTVAGRGKVPEMAEYLKKELLSAGFLGDEVIISNRNNSASLIAVYKSDNTEGKRPILLLGHMDVVEALAEDWERPPFELTEDETFFFGRGTVDNKYGIAMLVSTFIRLKTEGFVPSRDLILAFSGDEETDMNTTRFLANQHPKLKDAEFALNSDAGGGRLDDKGNALAYLVQAAEKTYATFELTVRNPGGHSSRPRLDNAIYQLASALKAIEAYQFPVRSSEMTRNFFKTTGEQRSDELGEVMIAFATNPDDEDASQRLSTEPSLVGSTRTTCIATKLNAGHAENALPQSATATINCRIFPGVSVAQVQAQLSKVVEDPMVEFVVLDNPIESPISELREDVMSAIAKAVRPRHANVPIIAYMESGGTDGMHFRSAGIPTWAMSSSFMNPKDMFAHGLNERLPKQAFYQGLDHWTIILKELAGN